MYCLLLHSFLCSWLVKVIAETVTPMFRLRESLPRGALLDQVALSISLSRAIPENRVVQGRRTFRC